MQFRLPTRSVSAQFLSLSIATTLVTCTICSTAQQNLYVSQPYNTPGTISTVAPGGVVSPFVDSTNAGLSSLNNSWGGMTFDSAGNLYVVSEAGVNQVLQISPSHAVWF